MQPLIMPIPFFHKKAAQNKHNKKPERSDHKDVKPSIRFGFILTHTGQQASKRKKTSDRKINNENYLNRNESAKPDQK